jgi:aminopeptidase
MILFYFNKQAGTRTGDRVWRMPLLKHYTKQVTESQLADVNNVGNIRRSGGACTAAAFLRVNKYFNCMCTSK